jgi:glycosyltransferase involved in cell wall biosynthesis
MSSSLHIYVLCRDRPAYAKEAISSLVHQITSCVEVIVSDNSTNNETEELVSQFYSNIQYIRRNPPLDSESHFRIILTEAKADSIVLFHDDDRALPGFVQTVLNAVTLFPKFSAIGFNATCIDANGKALRSPSTIFTLPSQNRYISIDPHSLINSYFSPQSAGSPPFPSYVYNRKVISEWMISSKYGGKHLDLCLLALLATKIPLIWSSEVVMEYRRHHGNDSANENILHRLRLKRFLFANNYLKKGTECDRFFTFQYWLFWWIQNYGFSGCFGCVTSWHRRVISFHLVKNLSIYIFTSKRVRKSLLSVLLRAR